MDERLKEMLGPLADFDDERPVPLEEQIKCLQREMSMRVQLYPKWVDSGRKSEKEAKLELKRMKACLQTLVNLKAEEERALGIAAQQSFQM